MTKVKTARRKRTARRQDAAVLQPKLLPAPGVLAAERARKSTGVSRAYDDVDEFIGDLKIVLERSPSVGTPQQLKQFMHSF